MSQKIKKSENISKDTAEVLEDEDDVIFESENNEEINFAGNKIASQLREKLKKATAEKQEYLAGWQRAKADLINAKKEFGEDRIKLLKFANADLIVQLIPVLDSFEMALNIESEEKVLQEWLLGLRHIYNQLLSVLKENGVEQINPLKEKFNSEFHTALETIKVDSPKSENIILEVARCGYFLNGKVLREAEVKIGKYEQ